MSVWSSGMIVRSGRTGPGFDSRNGPFFKTATSMTHEGEPWLNRANFNFKTISVAGGFHMSDLKKFSRFEGTSWAEIGWLGNGLVIYEITG